jgi:hypothetical protein
VFEAMSEDPDRDLLGRLLMAWRREFGTDRVGVRELVARATDWQSRGSELKEVIHEIADERGEINRRRLGRWVARHQGMVAYGLRLEREPSKTCGSERWKLVVISVSGVGAGDSAESVSGVVDDVEVF